MALVWLVTGVSSGLGHEIALKALKQGHKLIGTVRSVQKAGKLVQELESHGGKILELDITDAEACFAVWRSAEKIHGRIDVLCNNAGMSYNGALEDFTDDEVHSQMEVNFFGPYRLIRAALPSFRKQKAGLIVNISSVSGIDGSVASGVYAASKFALEGLSEGLAKEVAEYNVHVIIVEPGAFRTNFLSAFKSNSKTHLELYSTAKRTMMIFDTFSGKQRGDPAKAAEKIVEVASGQGTSGHLRGKILRLPLGPDCLNRYEEKVKSMLADFEKVRDTGMNTDIAS